MKLFFVFTFLIAISNLSFAQNDIPSIKVRAKNQVGPNTFVFANVDTAAQFPNTDCSKLPKWSQPSQFQTCSQSMLQYYINKTVYYPDSARGALIMGTVITDFWVDSTGQVGQIQVFIDPSSVNGNIGILGKEAKRVFEKMAREEGLWTPAQLNGQPVAMAFRIPIRFKL